MQAAFKDLPNVHIIADDILICGHGKTMTDAMKNHDDTMNAFLNHCLYTNIIFNPDKFVYKMQKIQFMGHILTDQGILPDPEKVQAIVDIPFPDNAAAVRRLNGCINYLSRYTPHLADLTKPLRDLTHKGVAFKWETYHTEAVERIKTAPIYISTCVGILRYQRTCHNTV